MASPNSTGAVFAQVKATATENRLRDLWHRKKQLLSFHTLLTKNVGEVTQALSTDDAISQSEAQRVLAVTLLEITTHYDSLNLKKELKSEYRVKWGKDNEDRRIRAPLVYISSCDFNLFYSVLSALSAATAAGSCCLIKLENSLQTSPALLRKYLAQVYDPEAVGITTTTPDASILAQCLVVDQTGELKDAPGNRRFKALTSSPHPMAVAVVDRTADIGAAARGLAQSRLLFAGRSTQAIDLVLVNDFVADDLAARLAEELARQSGGKQGVVDNSAGHKKSPHQEKARLGGEPNGSSNDGGRGQTLYEVAGVSVVKIGADRKIRDKKTAPGVIALSTITSLDDAIDRLEDQGVQLNTLYLFAKLNEARYLSQFISTDVTIVNHIPLSYLVGPAAPWGCAVSCRTRYSRAMFEIPSPQFVSSSGKEEEEGSASRLLEEASGPLKPTRQPEGGAMGFFDVAVGVGALVYLLPSVALTLGAVSVAAYKAYGMFG
ncbi:hypothetical protein EDB81DRAFT_894828 [Dactylonectria macrodidyma]|uniref:Aldehyde dehydrogenase domain-containing protein n=1 Tax=Dactylonectria macrodidyma TaxID=307937 RepID=A0A9P9D028_9HYPO|nr:hypothetical protein EDB81DRAFT_894828 [Dactylonectria macrodidyma]